MRRRKSSNWLIRGFVVYHFATVEELSVVASKSARMQEFKALQKKSLQLTEKVDEEREDLFKSVTARADAATL